MIWKGTKVTINNYDEVFKNYSKDIKEVIRSAILDDTPLEPYIKRNITNPYLLWQIKLGLDEGVERVWFDSIAKSGEFLYEIRYMRARGINIDPLRDILLGYHLPEEYYKYVLKWYNGGVALERYNLSIIPKSLLEVFDYGIVMGYPMYLFNTGITYSREYVLYCLKILSRGKDISKFLSGTWDEDSLSLLSRFASGKYYDDFIDYITSDVTPSVLEGLYECCKVGVPMKEVAVVDREGVYVYSKAHLSLIKEAYLNKYEYKELLDCTYAEAVDRLNEMRLKASKKLSGRLRK